MARLSTWAAMPWTVSVPEVSGDTQWIMRTVEVLPAPFGPRKPKHSPSLISKEMRSTALNLPYFLQSLRAVMMVFMAWISERT